MFEITGNKRPIAFRILKFACAMLLASFLVIGMISAYRAWYQVASLDLTIRGFDRITIPIDRRAPSVVRVKAGSTIETNVVSYARGPVDVKLEIIQGAHAETIATQRVPGNEWAFFDPRQQQKSQVTVLSDEVLSRFAAGRASIRAIAIGREQWTRLPPPVVEEMLIDILRN